MTDSRVEAATADRMRPVAMLRATPTSVWLLVVLQALLGTAYALAVPLLHAPDEHAHTDLVLNVSDHVGVDPYAGLHFNQRTLEALRLMRLDAIDWRVAPMLPWVGLDEASATPRGRRPAYADLGPDLASGTFNTAATHPPLYYAVIDAGAAVARWVLPGDEDWSWEQQVSLLRILTALLASPLPLLAYWVAASLLRRHRPAIVAAVVPLAIPQLTHLSGAVNNDALMVTLASALMLPLVWVARGDLRYRVAVAAGALAGLGMLTKIFLLPAPLWILAAYVVAWRRGAAPNTVVARLVAAAGATVAAGAWWPLRLLVTEGTVAPRPFLYPRPEVADAPFLPWVGEVIDRLTSTFWGHFGVESWPLPNIVIIPATLIAAVLVAVGYRRARAHHLDLALLALPVVTTLTMILYAAWSGYIRTGLPVGLHGRYLFVGVVGFGVLAGVALDHLAGRLGPLAAIVAAGAVQLLGMWVVIANYYEAPSSRGEVTAMLAWAPWESRWVGLLAVAIGASAAVLALTLHRDDRSGQPDGGSAEPANASAT